MKRLKILFVLLESVLFTLMVLFFLPLTQCKEHHFRLEDVLREFSSYPALSAKKQELPLQVAHTLEQPFYFFGEGEQFFVFLSKDRKSILKLFKKAEGRNYSQMFSGIDRIFHSAQDRSALLYIHLHQEENLPTICLIDRACHRHKLLLGETPFLIQQRGEPLFDRLKRAQGNERLMKELIDEVILCFLELCREGMRDTDNCTRRNLGFLDKRAVILDVGSLFFDPALQQKEEAKKEILHKTRRLGRWLKRRHPALYAYYLERIQL